MARSGSRANKALLPFLVLPSPPPLKRPWLTSPHASFPLTVNPRPSHTNLVATGLDKGCPSAVPQVSVGQQANPPCFLACPVRLHASPQYTMPSQLCEEAGSAPASKGNTQVSHQHSLPLHFHRLLSCDCDLHTPTQQVPLQAAFRCSQRAPSSVRDGKVRAAFTLSGISASSVSLW